MATDQGIEDIVIGLLEHWGNYTPPVYVPGWIVNKYHAHDNNDVSSYKDYIGSLLVVAIGLLAGACIYLILLRGGFILFKKKKVSPSRDSKLIGFSFSVLFSSAAIICAVLVLAYIGLYYEPATTIATTLDDIIEILSKASVGLQLVVDSEDELFDTFATINRCLKDQSKDEYEFSDALANLTHDVRVLLNDVVVMNESMVELKEYSYELANVGETVLIVVYFIIYAMLAIAISCYIGFVAYHMYQDNHKAVNIAKRVLIGIHVVLFFVLIHMIIAWILTLGSSDLCFSPDSAVSRITALVFDSETVLDPANENGQCVFTPLFTDGAVNSSQVTDEQRLICFYQTCTLIPAETEERTPEEKLNLVLAIIRGIIEIFSTPFNIPACIQIPKKLTSLQDLLLGFIIALDSIHCSSITPVYQNLLHKAVCKDLTQANYSAAMNGVLVLVFQVISTIFFLAFSLGDDNNPAKTLKDSESSEDNQDTRNPDNNGANSSETNSSKVDVALVAT